MNLSTLKTSKHFKKDPAITFNEHGLERYWPDPDFVIELCGIGHERFFVSHIEVSEDDDVILNSTTGRELDFGPTDNFSLDFYKSSFTV